MGVLARGRRGEFLMPRADYLLSGVTKPLGCRPERPADCLKEVFLAAEGDRVVLCFDDLNAGILMTVDLTVKESFQRLNPVSMRLPSHRK
jgi:hypothetical protein